MSKCNMILGLATAALSVTAAHRASACECMLVPTSVAIDRNIGLDEVSKSSAAIDGIVTKVEPFGYGDIATVKPTTIWAGRKQRYYYVISIYKCDQYFSKGQHITVTLFENKLQNAAGSLRSGFYTGPLYSASLCSEFPRRMLNASFRDAVIVRSRKGS